MSDISCVRSSFTNIDQLTDDVLIEIFTRLPFRSTARCKRVCKRWLDLISNPQFPTEFICRQHSLFEAYLIYLSPHELMLSFLPPFPPQSLEHLGFNDQNQKAPLAPDMLIKGNVCGCSNGLFLCCNNRYTAGRDFYVYDPLIQKCRQVAPSLERGKETLYAVGFVSDPYYHLEGTKPSLNPNRCFWVVIMRSFIRTEYQFVVEVFSSEIGVWRKVVVTCIDGFAFAPHWLLSFAYEKCLYFMGRTSIFVFDPLNLYNYTIGYPEGADAMDIMSFGYLGRSCGSLRIADIGHNDLRVWELLGSQNWHLLHRTNLSAHLPAVFCTNYYKRVGGFHPYDGDIVYLHSYADGVFAANLQTNKFEAIPGYEKSDISPFQLELPSLVPSIEQLYY
ncbi:F-box protein At5g07610-like [Abrus precatorius]|uniref:F-box protein At5g07610-like n=1 Tax=Abrus precatorius TaxID=3816 RepID=A0A8B8KM05_ABRPR|nr:F-box protein At5g07610-like [Abrus precatorius]